MNKLVYVKNLNLFLEWWPFFVEALPLLNNRNVQADPVTGDEFFKLLLFVSQSSISEGAIILLTSKNDKPLGFVVVLNNTPPFGARVALCYAVFSNNKCERTVKELDKEVNVWLKKYEYKKIYAASRMIHGRTVRWFRQRGFHRDCLIYCRNV